MKTIFAGGGRFVGSWGSAWVPLVACLFLCGCPHPAPQPTGPGVSVTSDPETGYVTAGIFLWWPANDPPKPTLDRLLGAGAVWTNGGFWLQAVTNDTQRFGVTRAYMDGAHGRKGP